VAAALLKELYFEKVKRVVKQDGKVKFEGKWYHVNGDLSGKTVEVNVTLRGIEVWHNGVFIKRWKYWENIIDIAFDYMQNKYLL
jgi:hypothetical protein